MIKLNLQLHASEKITGKIERKYMAHLHLIPAIGKKHLTGYVWERIWKS